eukprot:TRINITY_DN3141_c1_g1_i1.p1 TRINITY_DN3141_c1_g1~~TRINITY_DN3141_c1_g1_i1.p1  ORF type:complete len:815 (+),score=197.67 TRINITY_DN3141_c1_g1_i1:106-2445(+)
MSGGGRQATVVRNPAARGSAVAGTTGSLFPSHLGGAGFPEGGGGPALASPSWAVPLPPGMPYPGGVPGFVPPPAHLQQPHTVAQGVSELPAIRAWCATATPQQLYGEAAKRLAREAARAVRKGRLAVAALGAELLRVGMSKPEPAAVLLRRILDSIAATSDEQLAEQLHAQVLEVAQEQFEARHNQQGGPAAVTSLLAHLYNQDLLTDRAFEAIVEELMELCVADQKNSGCVLLDAVCAGFVLNHCTVSILRNLGPEGLSGLLDKLSWLRQAVGGFWPPEKRELAVASLDRAFESLQRQLPSTYRYRPRDSCARLFPSQSAQPQAAAPPPAASDKGPQQGPPPPTPPQPPQQQQPQGEKEDEALRLIAERPGECHGDPLAALQGLLSEVQAADQAVDGNRIAAVGAAASILCVVMADVPRQRRRYTPKELWALQPAAPTELSPLPEALVRAVHTTLGKPADPIVITAEERQSVEYLASPEELAELAEPPLSRTIYMVGLDANCSMRQLLKILLACGQVTRVRLCGDPMNPIIYGFVEYARRSAARNFLGSWHNEWIGHGRLTLSWAKSPIKDGIGEDTTAETVRLLRVRPETLNIPITQSELMEQSNRASRRNADHPPAAAARPWVQPPDHGPTPYRSGGDDQRSSSSRGSGGGGGRFKAGSSHGSAHSSGQGGSSAPGGGQPGQRGGGGSLPPQTSLAGVPWTSQRVSLSMAQAAGIGGSPVSPSLAPVQFPGGKPCGNGGGLGGALEPELPIPVQAQGRSEVPAFVYSPGQSPPPDM